MIVNPTNKNEFMEAIAIYNLTDEQAENVRTEALKYCELTGACEVEIFRRSDNIIMFDVHCERPCGDCVFYHYEQTSMGISNALCYYYDELDKKIGAIAQSKSCTHKLTLKQARDIASTYRR